MKKFLVLVQKEVRELLTPYMLVPLLITVVLFAGIGKLAGSEMKKAQQPQPIAIVDYDQSPLSTSVIAMLKQANFTPETYTGVTVDQAIAKAKEGKSVAVAVIPANFSQTITQGKTQEIEVYSILRSFSLTATKNDCRHARPGAPASPLASRE